MTPAKILFPTPALDRADEPFLLNAGRLWREERLGLVFLGFFRVRVLGRSRHHLDRVLEFQHATTAILVNDDNGLGTGER